MRLYQPDPDHVVADQNSLLVYDSRRKYEQGDASSGSSIPNLTGYTISAGGNETINFVNTYYTIVAFKAGARYEKEVFAWASLDERDRFLVAMTNMCEGRPWNKTAEELAEQTAPQPQPEPEPETEPEPEPVAVSDLVAMSAEEVSIAPVRVAYKIGGDALFSPPFSSYLEALKAQPSNTALRSEETVADECRAEAFRVWSLKTAVESSKARARRVQTLASEGFQRVNSEDAPFNGFHIYSEVGLTDKMVKYFHEDISRAESGTTTRQRQNVKLLSLLLQRNDENPAERKKKQENLDKLGAIMDKFSEYGIVPPDNDDDSSHMLFD